MNSKTASQASTVEIALNEAREALRVARIRDTPDYWTAAIVAAERAAELTHAECADLHAAANRGESLTAAEMEITTRAARAACDLVDVREVAMPCCRALANA